MVEWSKLLAAVGVTGLAGWLAEGGSTSLVRFFLRKPRLGIKTSRSGAQKVQTAPGVGRRKGEGGHGGTAGVGTRRIGQRQRICAVP